MITGIFLAQVGQGLAQDLTTSPSMEIFEFLGNWNREEGKMMDSLLEDLFPDPESPIQKKGVESPFPGRSQDGENTSTSLPLVEQKVPGHYEE